MLADCIMKKEIISQIQKKVIRLLRENSNKPLYIASKDNCSEVARLVGIWIPKQSPESTVYILKGDNVLGTKHSHDILAVESNKNIDLIDPTVWQFFKDKKSIFIGNVNNLSDSLKETNKIYGGKWKISELLDINSYNQDKLEKIIRIK